MGGQAMRGASVIEPVLALGVWWSVWSIADFYLLSYSPYGELLVLAACLLALSLRRISASPSVSW